MFHKSKKRRIAIYTLVLVLLVSMIGTTMVQAEPIVYRVSPGGASASPCGVDWANPCDLQYALTTLASSGSELWVTQGVYKPGNDRTDTFTLKNGVEVYGGFAGTETLRTQRDHLANVSILSGDIGVVGDNSDNSYHIVVGSNTDNSAVLDGFTITDGNADGGLLALTKGAGMYNYLGSPTVRNMIFSNNSATFGAGMYNYGEQFEYTGKYFIPVITNVVFINNSAFEGGGMRNENYSSPILTDVTFDGNSVTRGGGGMENFDYSSPVLNNVTFKNNIAGAGGGMLNWVGNNPILTNVTFVNNAAIWNGGGGIGGGMSNYQSSPSLTNVTFSGNSASNSGGGLHNDNNSNLIVRNTILWGNTAPDGAQVYNITSAPVINDSVVEGGYAGGTNIVTTDPMLGTLGNYGGFTETVPLLIGSSAIDTGNDASCPATDQRGIMRPQGLHCDIGAFEYVEPATPTPDPTKTPRPTKTPKPTKTPRPTRTPKA